jgi:hypothetical protein
MNSSACICVSLILLAAFARAGDDTVIQSIQAEQDVALTANPGSTFWRKESAIYAERDRYGKSVTRHRTEIRSRWTRHYLYFLFICPYDELYLKPAPDTTSETFQLWDWDVAEVFIGSDFENIRRYKEFEVSPQGEWIDLDIDMGKPQHDDWKWNSGFQTIARIDRAAKTWYAAMRIPFVAVSKDGPTPGATFRINFFRVEGADPQRKYAAWQPPMSETFHVPERFGILKLK